MSSVLLTLMTFVPMIGAIAILGIKASGLNRPFLYKWIALACTTVCLVIAGILWAGFDPTIVNKPQFVHHAVWIRDFNIEYFMGVDGISISLVILTALISFIACIASFNIDKKPAGYFTLFLLLETGMLGTFCALDMFLFYIFWEVMLLPMYFLIGIWGGPRKEYAAIKFFLYTLAGSVLMLLAVIAIYYTSAPVHGVDLKLVFLPWK